MTPEEKQELLQIAKENGTQAVPILITIVEDIVSDDESMQELLQIAKENGTQAVPILITIVEGIIPDDESMQELLQIAKENGTQAVHILTEIIEKLPEKPPFTFKIDDKEVENGQYVSLTKRSVAVKLEAKNAALLSDVANCRVTKHVGASSESASVVRLIKSTSEVAELTLDVNSDLNLTRFEYIASSSGKSVFTIELNISLDD